MYSASVKRRKEGNREGEATVGRGVLFWEGGIGAEDSGEEDGRRRNDPKLDLEDAIPPGPDLEYVGRKLGLG